MDLENERYTRNVLDVYKSVDRKLFVPKQTKVNFENNIPIGFGQTITQTKIVLDVLIKSKLEKNHRVLEIGTGSGYQTLLASRLSREVYTIELVKELSIAAQKRIQRIGGDNVHYRIGDGTYGWEEYSPYDRILVSACCEVVPKALFQQLNKNGIMIVPVGDKQEQILMKYVKKEDGTMRQEALYSVRFVEFRGENGWK